MSRTLDAPARANGGTPARSARLVEALPFLVLAVAWVKLVFVGLLLPSVSWAGAEPLDPLAALRAHPDAFTATLGLLLLLAPPLLLLPRVARLALLLLLDLALTCLAVADLIHVRFYADVWSVSSLAATSMLGWVADSLVTLPRRADLAFFLDLPLLLLLLPAYAALCRRTPPLPLRARARAGAAPLLVAALLLLPTARLATADGGLFGYSTIRLEVASAIGLLPYHLADAGLHAARDERPVAPADFARVRRFLDDRRRDAPPPSALFGAAAGANVLVVSAESIQAFVVGLAVDGQPVAPHLTALARESLYFADHYEPTHLGSTADAEFAVMQSLYPLPIGVVAARHADNGYHGLPAVLAERGYETFSAVGATSYFWNMHRLHPRYGFRRSYYEEHLRVDERIAAWISDRQFFAQLAPILRAQPEPFMGFLLTSSSHHPYVIPDGERTLRLGRHEGTMLGDYLHAVHYFDRQLGAFVERLRADGLLDRTLFVLYGDHQAFLYDEAGVPDLLGFDSWSEYQHFRVVKRTPLLIRLPGGVAAGVRAGTSSHIDVAPTVLALLGIDDGRTPMLGRDLTRDGDGLVVFRDGSFAAEGRYYVNRFAGLRASRCYDAASGAPADCAPLEARRGVARETLELSDAIVRGDLIPTLRAGADAPPLAVRPPGD